MGKQSWKPGNMLYPVPAVLVSCRDKEGHRSARKRWSEESDFT